MTTATSRIADAITASPFLAAVLAVVLAAASALLPSFAGAAERGTTKPTVVLIQGAFAESSSGNNVLGP